MRWALLGAAVLALLAGAIPWPDCPHCEVSHVPVAQRHRLVAEGWSCPACLDRQRLSFWGRLRTPRLAPSLLALAGRSRLLGSERDALLASNGLDPEEEYRPRGMGFPKIYGAFMDSEAGWRFLLAYAGSRGMFGMRHPAPFPVRLYLFDPDGRLLDRWEIAPAGPQLCADVEAGAAAGEAVVDLVPPLGDPLPPDAAFDLLRDGRSGRRMGASLRITLRSGRLAEAP